MKLSLFSITAVLASFVAANPILAPRAPSRSFRLLGDFGTDGEYLLLAILPVAEPNHPGYFQFGWYGKGSEKIELFFAEDQSSPGAVFDVRQNGYEMVLQAVPDGNTGSSYYRPLLIDRANTALSGLQSPSRFFSGGDYFYSIPEGSDDPADANDPDAMRWMTCIRSTTIVATDPEYAEDLIFSSSHPSDCAISRTRVSLAVDYVSVAAVELSVAAVEVSAAVDR